MDQSKTTLPHFMYHSKLTSAMWKLKVHLLGVILHGIGISGYFDLFEFPHSANLTISTLITVFSSIKPLPPTLYLQMDNCYRENKNRFVLGFLYLLVELGIFTKVKISFLMVGHTHEDVDQVFSRFSNWLSRKACLTLTKLMSGFEHCTSPHPTAVKTTKVWDVSGWLSESLNKMSNHSYPHVFKIQRKEGKTKFYFKKWSTCKEWCEPTNSNILTKIPEGSPPILQPDYSKIELEKLESDVKATFKYFKNDEDKNWWNDFFQELHTDDEVEHEEWPLDALVQNSKERDLIEENCIDEESLSDLSDEDEPIPPVIVGSKKKDKTEISVVTGEMVLLDLEDYKNEWPQVGQVLDVSDKISIQWYKGSRSTLWKPCSKPIKGKKGKRERWVTEVDMNSIIFGGFTLTKNDRLPKHVKDFISNTYKCSVFI